MQSNKKIKVKIADIAVGTSPQILTTFGLGSCVAVMLYDPVAKVGGMNHFLLPTESSSSRGKKNPAKFSDSGIEILLRKINDLGGKKERLVAKLVGGANMFPSLTKNSIGQKNVDAALKILNKHSITVSSMDTGGNWGRSVEFHLSDGNVIVKSYKRGEKRI
jgi:chemotaxis protein CheD